DTMPMEITTIKAGNEAFVVGAGGTVAAGTKPSGCIWLTVTLSAFSAYNVMLDWSEYLFG
ncbi:MAG: hypothetical protein MUF37_07535, partial [Methanoregulaceae archaeon]|nr:hypothetical protein [Methanoregulaceae archaeon]